LKNTRHEQAFRALVREHSPYVWRVLRSLGVPDSELPDVAQETFITIYRQLPGFEGRSSVRTWVYGVALRVASDYRGKAYRRRECTAPELPEMSAAATQHGAVERREAWELVATLLTTLDEDRRRVFVLYELEQLPLREVARILDCPISTVHARLQSARETVQAALLQQRRREASA
jgi:RNA polymerase sigma-70 factor (ECF subfamily)